MDRRLKLQELLVDILESPNVYFQPPPSVQMQYPAIRYSLSRIANRHANNGVYNQNDAYEIILMDFDPDSEFREKISRLPMCSFDRSYTSDGLNHYVFTLYF